jgi:hypothetical protein
VTSLQRVIVVLAASAAFAVVQGCDGGVTGQGGSAGSDSGGGGAGGSAGSTTGGGGAGGSSTGGGGAGGSSTGGGGAGGGAPSDVGAPAMDLVSAGGVAKSTNFKMVFTLGQSTQNQGRTTSSNYVMQGGLIGATGSAK